MHIPLTHVRCNRNIYRSSLLRPFPVTCGGILGATQRRRWRKVEEVESTALTPAPTKGKSAQTLACLIHQVSISLSLSLCLIHQGGQIAVKKDHDTMSPRRHCGERRGRGPLVEYSEVIQCHCWSFRSQASAPLILTILLLHGF